MEKGQFTLPIDTIIKNRYKIIGVIGIGGFGITYKVEDAYTDKIFAMKEYAPSAICYRDEEGKYLHPLADGFIASFEHGRKKFLEEADVLRRLDAIPGIVPVMDCFNQNQTSYFVMQYLEGRTLKDHLKAHDGRLGSGETLAIIGNVA